MATKLGQSCSVSNEQEEGVQEEAKQTDIENRIALQKMEAENQNIKNLLVLLGFSASSIQHYLRLGHQGSCEL